MKRAIYVDYENVNISGLEAIEELSNEDVVKIFIGAQTSKLTMVDANRIFNCEASVELITNKYIGKNALDFIIMVHMGYDIAQGLAKAYYIISKDKGYDPAIHEMRKMSNLTVSRREDISAVLEEKKSFGGRIKGLFGFGKVKETPDTTQHTVVGKGKKDSNEMSKITKEYVSDEPVKQSKNQKRGKKTGKSEKLDKIEKSEKVVNPEKPKKNEKITKPEKTYNSNNGNVTERGKKTDKPENSVKSDTTNKTNIKNQNQKNQNRKTTNQKPVSQKSTNQKSVNQKPADQQPDNQNPDKTGSVAHENTQKGSSNSQRQQRGKKYNNKTLAKELASVEVASDISSVVPAELQKEPENNVPEKVNTDNNKENGVQRQGKGRAGNRYNSRGGNNRRRHYEKHNDDNANTANKVPEHDVSDKNENPVPSDNGGFSNKTKIQDRTESVEVVHDETEIVKYETAETKHETELERQRREAFELLAELNEENGQNDNFKYKKRK